MDKLDKSIKKWVLEKRKELNIEIIYSSCYVESEGEHKLLQFIRKNKNKYKNHVIYGLDADLIFLSLATFEQNIYLLRESNVINKKDNEKLLLISVDFIIYYIIEEFKKYIVNKDNINQNKLIADFIFICFFLGNDFLPNIPSLSLYSTKNLYNGLDLLIYCYCKTFNMFNLNILNLSDKVNINIEVLINFIDNLVLFEKEYFIESSKNKKPFKKYQGKNDPYDKELFKIENLLFKIEDPVKLGIDSEEQWKFRYYKNYFCIINNYETIVSEACFNYLKGLIWNCYYYFFKCPSWTWYYNHNYTPFISDIRKYIKNFNFNDFKFNENAIKTF